MNTNKSERASERVFKYIEQMILNKEWKVGDKIASEMKLAEVLEVSRISVREAIGSLVTLNILERTRGGGTFVKQLTPNDYMDQLMPLLTVGDVSYIEIMETRLALDVEAVTLFVERATNTEILELENILKTMISHKNNPDGLYKEDMHFHSYIAKYCQNKILSKITEMLSIVLTNYAKDQYHSLTYEQRIREHTLIFNSIKSRDLELSRLYMRRHVTRTIEDLKKKSKINHK